MQLNHAGFRLQNLFPAAAIGEPALLRALAPVSQQTRFCPTDRNSAASAADYLGLENVCSVGGSWLTPASLLQDGNRKGVTALAASAAALRRAN